MNKKGFTLIELLAVIVILALTFLFVVPEISNLVKRGDDTTNKLNEERIISAAKEYTSNNNNLFNTMTNVGDTVYILKEDLLNSKLIDEKDISSLDNFVSVKCELLENDKIKYIVMYE